MECQRHLIPHAASRIESEDSSDPVLPNIGRDESDEAAEIENVFIQGKFRAALLMANRFIVSNSPQKSIHDDVEHERGCRTANLMVLPLPVTIDVDGRTFGERYLCIRCPSSDSDDNEFRIDRAAAVALQSWYELSKLEKVKHDIDAPRETNPTPSTTDSALRHLLPFLEQYTVEDVNCIPLNISKGMSVGLLLLFVQFCKDAIHDVRSAMEICRAFLCTIKQQQSTSFDHPSRRTQEEVRELLLYTFTQLIPNCRFPVAEIESFFEQLSLSHPRFGICCLHRQSSLIVDDEISTRKGAIQRALCFCNTKDSSFPKWLERSFRDCRTVLQKQLRPLYHDKKKLDPNNISSKESLQLRSRVLPSDQQKNDVSNEMPVNKFAFNSTEFLSRRKSGLSKFIAETVRRTLRFFASSNSFLRILKDEKSSGGQRSLALRAVCYLCVVAIAWKQRQRVLKLVRTSLSATVGGPVLELLEAFGVYQQPKS